MKLKTLCALGALTMLAGPTTHAETDPWSDADITRQAVTETLLAIDWGQTRCLAKGHGCTPGREYYEQNPMLGNHPSLARVNNYFIGSMLVNPLIVHYLPAHWRPYFQGVYIAFQTGVANHNREIGLKVCF